MGGALSVRARESARESAREDEPACVAAGQSKRRRDHCALDDVHNTVGGIGKRVRSCDNDGASGSIVCYSGHQFDRSDKQETQSLLFSSSRRATTIGNVQEPSGSTWNAQQLRLFELDPTKHKIFLSHSGAQKDFVEQLCVDLEARGYLFPFFDQRHHSLPKGKDFVPLIKQAARLCHVAVIVLSKEFLCSKWPMIELAEFYAAKQGENDRMNMLPLFYKLSVGDLDDRSIEDRWMPKWNEHAEKDNSKRIDVREWAAAVRALRGANGVVFGQNTSSEVGYRKEIVQSIWKLSPGDLLYGSAREMVGYHRICERVSNRFVEGTWIGAPVLAVYGTSGFGKTTLMKALCDYFAEEFMGRVCHVELSAMATMEEHKLMLKRQKLMLKTLCGIDDISDDRKGLNLMRDCMQWEPVFLVIDNVSNDESSRKEAYEYLTMGFHAKSKIVITARSKEVLQDLVPGVRFCMSMPRLNEEEAGRIFLRSAAPTKCFFSLTDEEQTILRLCIQKCLLEADSDERLDEVENPDNSVLNGLPEYRAYHPLALSALGDFFYRLSSNCEMLRWKDSLEEENEVMRDVLQSPSIRSIIGLQFSTLSSSEQLLFLDIALYTNHDSMGKTFTDMDGDFDFWVEWLCALHEETASVIERRLRDLKRSAMINWGDEYEDYNFVGFEVHSLYGEFAVWYVREHGVAGLKNVWGVFQPCGSSLGSHHPGSKCISDLVRLRVDGSTRSNIWSLLRNGMVELQNLVLLQLYDCSNLRELSLAGLDSLRRLELFGLSDLVEVTLTRSSGSEEDGGIFGSLQYVVLWLLQSLTRVPDFRACTSLRHLEIAECKEVTNFEAVECPHLRFLSLWGLVQHQLGRLPNFRSLQCLKSLNIRLDGNVDFVYAMDVHGNPYSLTKGRPVKGAVHEGTEGSDEFSGHSDAAQYENIREGKTIINMPLESQFGKEGFSIMQKVLLHLYQMEWVGSQSSNQNHLWWSFYEDDREVLSLFDWRGRKFVTEWRFKDAEEYDDELKT